MAALTAQFKIKCRLEQEKFVRVVYANFLKWMYRPSIKTPHTGERLMTRSTEDIILVGRDSDRVKTLILMMGERDWVKILFLLAKTATEWRHYFCWWRTWPSKDAIFLSDHWDWFHPVQELNRELRGSYCIGPSLLNMKNFEKDLYDPNRYNHSRSEWTWD